MRGTYRIAALLAALAVVTAQPTASQDSNVSVVPTEWPQGSHQAPFLGSASSQEQADHAAHRGQTTSSVHESKKGKPREGWVYLIRHGEKYRNTDKTGLSQRGIKRAHCLSQVFGDSKHGIKYILAQDFKPDGRRRRPYETVKPLAKTKGIHLDHHCDRDDIPCAADYIRKHAQPKNALDVAGEDGSAPVSSSSKSMRGDNVLVVWEHARLSDIAHHLGVKGLHYPSDRYDVVFKVRRGKVHAIYSEECNGLDEEWFNWHGHRQSKHGKGGRGGRLIDDESWALHPDEDDDDNDGEQGDTLD